MSTWFVGIECIGWKPPHRDNIPQMGTGKGVRASASYKDGADDVEQANCYRDERRTATITNLLVFVAIPRSLDCQLDWTLVLFSVCVSFCELCLHLLIFNVITVLKKYMCLNFLWFYQNPPETPSGLTLRHLVRHSLDQLVRSKVPNNKKAQPVTCDKFRSCCQDVPRPNFHRV